MTNKLRAVLDIGSNTIRLLIAEVGQDQTFKKIYYQHQIARLGEGLQSTGMLAETGKQRAMDVFLQVVAICESYGLRADEIVAVATAAIRDAGNGQAFVDEVREKTGLCIRIIEGVVEAKLALTGAMLGLSKEVSQDMLLFDIGGGSTEFTRVFQGEIVDSISIKMGVVRLTETCLKSNPTSDSDYQVAKDAAVEFLKEVEVFWGDNQRLPSVLVGTAGTVTTLAAMVQNMTTYDASKIDDFHMSSLAFYALRDDLLSKTNAQRLVIPALEKGREDVIVAGIAMIEAMLERWGYTELVSVDSGLLVGLLHYP